MATSSIANYDTGGIVIGNPEYDDGLLKFPGADTYVAGTILAVKAVADAIADVLTGTGDGTMVATVAAGGIVPVAGVYTLVCTFAITNGGIFKLVDPQGNIIADNLTLRVGDGLVTTFVAGGIKMVITEGTTDFAAADSFAMTVVADGDWVIYADDGVGGAQIPKGILTVEEVQTGAIDTPFRPLISGRVRREKLVIDDGSTVTDEVVAALRDFTIIGLNVDELNIQDNQ